MSAAELRRSLSLWRRKERYRQRRLAVVRRHAHADKTVTATEAAQIHKWERLLAEATRMRIRRSRQLAEHAPLGERAYQFARTLIGTMEQGGNNVGPVVSQIIRANGGTPGEAWCGDFQAFVYRHVGSKAVTRSWASVAMLRGLVGVTYTARPIRGCLVRYVFDHVGMFVCWCDENGDAVPRQRATHIKTIEGNTGASGAVSDSSTGGDGVYEKVRARSLVRDFLYIEK